ncbi:hypothetical protein POV27_07150 [Aureisphaera galaxeae]|uniref:hypothetical protein n=1 Tax=Aureisphaera galaxeae TaxID=1538023 RepID=UPI0023503BF6|nr:hypothetical protein [Aureisphaera galaxeae]MDC8003822.1 hypothetical protein [Aureisphaera galaxeae]
MKIVSLISKLEKEYSHNYYMYIPLTIILQSCLGSIAAMYILYQGTTWVAGLELTICTVLCMGYNAAILAQANRTFGFWLLMTSLLLNSLLIMINLVV